MKSRYMLTAIFAVMLMIIGLFVDAHGQTDALQADLAKSLKQFETMKVNALKVRQSKTLTVTLDGRQVQIVLEANDLRSDDLKKSEKGKSINTFKGIVVGEYNSTVRLNFRKDGIEAIILSGGETYYLKSVFGKAKGASVDDVVTFKASDIIETGAAFCGVVAKTAATVKTVERQLPKTFSFVKAGFSGASKRRVEKLMQIDISSDKEFYLYHGSTYESSRAEIDYQLNIAEAIFDNHFDILFSVVVYRLHKNNNEDPWTFQSDFADDSLVRYKNWMNLYYPNNAYSGGGVYSERDVSILFTALFPGGSSRGIIGLAFFNSACSDQAYAFVGRSGGAAPAGIVTAHEIGHMAGEPDHYSDFSIMHQSGSLAQTSTFNATSQQRINAFVSTTATCIQAF